MTGAGQGTVLVPRPPTHLGEKTARTSNPEGWELVVHRQPTWTTLQERASLHPATNPQLLPNLIQAGLMHH